MMQVGSHSTCLLVLKILNYKRVNSITFFFQCKGAKLNLRIVRGCVTSDEKGAGSPAPFCKFVNLQLTNLKPSSGSTGTRGTVLLENPSGDYRLTNEELRRQVSEERDFKITVKCMICDWLVNCVVT